PGLRQAMSVAANVSLVDCYPTILDCLGIPMSEEDKDLPGTSLLPLAGGDEWPARDAFGEYHAMGSRNGVFMIRGDRYKYVEYIGQVPQLFDLREDPGELTDLADDPRYRSVIEECRASLREICDPDTVNHHAREDQARRIEELGGPDAVRARAVRFSHTPAPGE
ncbi:MAG: sulfatase/phosphatase domain-containing protein, partial [Chloroflexota bacterium]